jgi:hypothetical protein
LFDRNQRAAVFKRKGGLLSLNVSNQMLPISRNSCAAKWYRLRPVAKHE